MHRTWTWASQRTGPILSACCAVFLGQCDMPACLLELDGAERARPVAWLSIWTWLLRGTAIILTFAGAVLANQIRPHGLSVLAFEITYAVFVTAAWAGLYSLAPRVSPRWLWNWALYRTLPQLPAYFVAQTADLDALRQRWLSSVGVDEHAFLALAKDSTLPSGDIARAAQLIDVAAS